MRAWLLLLIVPLFAGCADDAPAAAEDSFSQDLDEQLDATATTGVIRGVVVDNTIVPIEGAEVTLLATSATTSTDANGAFGFSAVEPGSHFLQVVRVGFNSTQASVVVEVDVDRPPIVKILMEADPLSLPIVEELSFQGFLACGFAVVYTSVGCTTNTLLSSNTESVSIWSLDFERLPSWTQGELVWEDTQPASGNFIWQIVRSQDPGTTQPHIGYMETTASPALTYLDGEVIAEHAEWILETGIDYRFFAGPHDACPQHVGDPSVNRFGCGATLDQRADVFIHNFYGFTPEPGWRFTADGAHAIPQP